MSDEHDYAYTGMRSSRSMYEQYVSGGGGGQNRNRSRFESKGVFRSDLSSYSLHQQTIRAGSACKWDQSNCSGVPMDYEPSGGGTLYVDGTDIHTLIIGATGSKKSRLIVMPTVRILAAAEENMVICDPKGEIYRRTAGFLHENGYSINTINLREPQKGDGWNMLTAPYKMYCFGEIDKACEFINDMAINLMPLTAKDPYWDYSSRDMLFGLTLLLFKICHEKDLPANMVNMRNILQLKEELFCSTSSQEIQNTIIWNFAKQDDLIRLRLNGTIICPDRTLSCIISTFDQHMSCFFLQPQVVEMLSHSTFDLQNIGFRKCAIFLIMPDEKATFHKIITIFLKQMYELLIDGAFKQTEDNRFPSRINFILDEFSSLPAISDFPQMISASRSRNIRFILIVQSKHQLKQRYRDETDTIMSNCGNWMFLTSRETNLLREISELSGTMGTNNEPLVSISRLQHLDKEKGECLIFSGRKYPYIAELPDIDVYDSAQPPAFEMRLRQSEGNQTFPMDFFKKVINSSLEETLEFVSTQNKEQSISSNDMATHMQGVSRIQQELEVKFDELFGTTVDSVTIPYVRNDTKK